MAWQVYGVTSPYGMSKQFGPLPLKRWVARPGERYRVKHTRPPHHSAEAPREYNERRADLYARWLAQRDGLTVPPETKGIAAWSSVIVEGKARPEPRIYAVQFHKRRTSYSSETFGPSLLTIAIPNWDWVPHMTEHRDRVSALPPPPFRTSTLEITP